MRDIARGVPGLKGGIYVPELHQEGHRDHGAEKNSRRDRDASTVDFRPEQRLGSQRQGFAALVKVVSNVRAVRFCPAKKTTAGHLSDQYSQSFAGFCPACPAVLNIPYVTPAREAVFLLHFYFFLFYWDNKKNRTSRTEQLNCCFI